jgi:hypothetical protein
MLEKHPHVAETLASIRAGTPFLLPACWVCGKRNSIHADLSPKDATLPFALVRGCECLVNEAGTVTSVSEDAVVGMVRRLVVPTPPPLPPAAASPAPAEDIAQPNTAHLYFAVDTVCCAVCGGEEPFSIPTRTAYPTVLRALRVISDRHPASPHALRASL